ncbi:putative RPM1-interacting protein 4/NOI4 [Helianthus anomalus]
MAAQVKNAAESNNSESETPNNQTHATREADSFDSPKRVSSTLHQPKGGPRSSNTASPMWEPKVSSQASNGAPSSTPGRSRLRQVTLGDQSPDDSTAVPVFGDWDDNDPASAEGYSTIFDKVREEKHGGGGKSPRITSDNSNFYGHRPEAKKGCGCFPWGRK